MRYLFFTLLFLVAFSGFTFSDVFADACPDFFGSNPNNCATYQELPKLGFEDFQETTNPEMLEGGMHALAYVVAGHEYKINYQMVDSGCNFKITTFERISVFDRKQSFFGENDLNVLNHEQGHWNLLEIISMRVNEGMKNELNVLQSCKYDASTTSINSQIIEISQSYDTMQHDIMKRYDNETMDSGSQVPWDAKIACWMTNLDTPDFCEEQHSTSLCGPGKTMEFQIIDGEESGFCVGAGQFAPIFDEEFDRLYNEGVEYYNAGNIDASAISFRAAFDMYPHDQPIFTWLDGIYLELGLPEKTIEISEIRLQLFPNDPDALSAINDAEFQMAETISTPGVQPTTPETTTSIDSDGDGITDDYDFCPTEFGTDPDGCPEYEIESIPQESIPQESKAIMCPPGFTSVNGVCSDEPSIESSINKEEPTSKGGGCLIATATYGSELAPQVQQLRELRDNQLLSTESGTSFMNTFNDVYYSFSPVIADYERENPVFREAVKIVITPMITSLSLMENAETESEVLGIGISLIILNFGMYFGIPAVVIIGIRKRF